MSDEEKIEMENRKVWTSIVGAVLENAEQNPDSLNHCLFNLTLADDFFSESRMRDCAETAYQYLHSHPELLKQEDAIARLEQQGAEGIYKGVKAAVEFRTSIGYTAEACRKSDWDEFRTKDCISRENANKTAQQFIQCNTFTNYLTYCEGEARKQAGDYFLAARMNYALKHLKSPVLKTREQYSENAAYELLSSGIAQQFTHIGEPARPVNDSTGEYLLNFLPKAYSMDSQSMTEQQLSKISQIDTLVIQEQNGIRHLLMYTGDMKIDGCDTDKIVDAQFHADGSFIKSDFTDIQNVIQMLKDSISPEIPENQQSKVYLYKIQLNAFGNRMQRAMSSEVDRTSTDFLGSIAIAEDWLHCREQLKDFNRSAFGTDKILPEQEKCLEIESEAIYHATRQLRQGIPLEQIGNIGASEPYSHEKTMHEAGISDSETSDMHKKKEIFGLEF